MQGVREPALAPDGSRVVFVYAGELWMVSSRGGRANRLTDTEADEHRPVWSPVGERLAYVSDASGNDDVYVMALDGSSNVQVSFDSGPEQPSGFLPDGSGVLYQCVGTRGEPQLRVVSPLGGEPGVLADDPAFDAVASPTGRGLAFVQGAVPWWRQGYRGPAATNIRVIVAGDRRPSTIGPADLCALFPQWGRTDRYLYYVSDESPVRNVWVVDLQRNDRWQLTSHSDGPVSHLSVAQDGSRLAYEQGGRIWLADLPEEGGLVPRGRLATRRLKIDEISRETLHRTIPRARLIDHGLTSLELSADEETAVVSSFGDLYALPLRSVERPTLQNLTADPRRDRDASLSPDGRRLVFSSDRDGNYDLYMMESDDKSEPRVLYAEKRKVRTFRDDSREERLPKFSPDGSYVAFVRRDDEETLWLADASGGREIAIAEGHHFESFEFSPDGRWIAYARSDELGQMDVYVVSLFGAGEHNVSEHPGRDEHPVWSPNGRWLVFVSDRAGSRDLWGVSLRMEESLGFSVTGEAPLVGPPLPRSRNGAGPAAQPEVVIEAPGLSERLIQLTRLYGDETAPVFSRQSGALCFLSEVLGEADLWILAPDTREPMRLTDGKIRPQSIHPLRDGSFLLCTEKGTLERWSFGMRAEGYSVRFSIEPPPESEDERAQILAESWRLLRDGFYDPYLHLVRWDDVRKQMEARLPSVATREGLSDLVHRMVGRLNASHVGLKTPARDAVETPRIGIEPARFDGPWLGFSPGLSVTEGIEGVEIGRTLPGGPFDQIRWRESDGEFIPGPGDVILSVDGMSVGTNRSLARALSESDRPTHEIVCASRTGAEAETLWVTGVTDARLRDLELHEWVAQRAEIVRVLSANRFAYVHLRAVDRASADRLERDLFLQREKEGLILDLRGNPGGGAFERILQWFSADPAVFRQGREGARIPVPAVGWLGPVVVLVDGATASAAELLAHTLQARGGRVVGPGTYRGVIGTEEVDMIDGSSFRLPHTGWFTREGLNLENRGVVPDRRAEAEFEESRTGSDRILSQGVQELFGLVEGRGFRR